MTPTHRPALVLRAILLLAGCAALCSGTWWLVRTPVTAAAAPLLWRRPGGLASLPLETAVVGACGLVLLACVLWSVALTVLSTTGLLVRELAPRCRRTGRLTRELERLCPALVRRLVATGLGATLGAGLAVPALATIAPTPAPAPLTGLQLPDRTSGAGLATAARPAIGHRSPGNARHAQQGPRSVVVRPGDSLWHIAQTLLRPRAPDEEITRAWHLIHRANAARIGADPDLIHPGTRLALPPLGPALRKDSP